MTMFLKKTIRKTMSEKRVIISGGGTGGHIFPAISIANALKKLVPDIKILFVGAENRMEMQRVPEAGYEIVGLPVMGFDRKNLLRNVKVLFNLFRSQVRARRIVKNFKPQIAVGVGGYASGPTLKVASMMGIPTLIQEQNSYAGVTNKLLAKSATKICVAYSGMERFFPKDKIIITGNPVRQNVLNSDKTKAEALKQFGFEEGKKTVLVIGGSLGARTLNNALMNNRERLLKSNIQFIWQTGKIYYKEVSGVMQGVKSVCVKEFISDMGAAYKAADLVVSRAGASSISELQLLGKPVILVPSPNVAEDHQTKNAMALVEKDAAVCVRDYEVNDRLFAEIENLVYNEHRLNKMSVNIKGMANADSADRIAREILKIIDK